MVEIHFISLKIAKTAVRTADNLQINFHGSRGLFVLLKVKIYSILRLSSQQKQRHLVADFK